MAATHHHLLLLLLFFMLHGAPQVYAGVQTWYKALVSNATLDNAKPRGERSVRSVAQCTMMASLDPHAQLLCFRTPDVCTKYDMRVVAGHDSSSSNGSVTPCWTRNLPEFGKERTIGVNDNGTVNKSAQQNQGCKDDGKLRVNDNCTIMECRQGSMRPYQGPSAANITFSHLMAKNCCYLVERLVNWNEARSQCRSEGGDLFVAGDFRGMLAYLDKTTSNFVSVGAKARVWLDGRTVYQEEWATNQPNDDSDDCVFYIKKYIFNDSKGLYDGSCTYYKEFFLCQKGVSYPYP